MNDNIEFNSANMYSGVAWRGSSGFSQSGTKLILSGKGEWCECTLTDTLSYKYLRNKVSYVLEGISSTRYNPQLMCEITCVYSDKRIQKIVEYIGEEAANNLFNSEDVFEILVGTKTVTIKFTSMASSSLSISSYECNRSDEISWDSIMEVVEEATISVEVIHSVLSWVDNLQVNTLETNLSSKSAIGGSTGRRDFILAKDRTIDFKEEHLSEELEQLQILAGGEMCPVFYTAIENHEQAYKYVTLTDPRTVHKDLDDATYEKYKYMVYKPFKSSSKMKIYFEDEVGPNGGTTGIPRIRFGEGTTIEEGDEVGCATIVKGFNGFEIYYVRANNEKVSIRMDDTGGYLEGFKSVGGGEKLSDIQFYNNGFICKHGDKTTKYTYKTDSNGRLTGLTTQLGVNVNIGYNSTNIPLSE